MVVFAAPAIPRKLPEDEDEVWDFLNEIDDPKLFERYVDALVLRWGLSRRDAALMFGLFFCFYILPLFIVVLLGL